MNYLQLFIWAMKMTDGKDDTFIRKCKVGAYVVKEEYKWRKACRKLSKRFEGEELETAQFAISRGFSYKGVSM